MEKIRLGLIGCGGRAGAHMHSFEQMADVEVVAVADPVAERREAAAKRFGCQRMYPDHRELYAHESRETLDAVVIAIEPTAHIGVEEGAIDLNLPFIVEKPMTLDLHQAEEIARRVEEKGLITSVGFQDRYLDLMEIIRDELSKHPAGGLVYGAWIGGIPGVWWWQKKSTCGGQLVEQNIHLLDGLRFLYGEPLSVYATCSRGMIHAGENGVSPEYDTDDHSTAVIRFENNVTATLVSGCYSRSVRPNCGLVITLPDMVIDYRLRNNLILRTANQTLDINRQVDQTLLLDRAFVDAVRSGDASGIRSPYADALKSLKLGFAANESMESGQVIYF